MTDKEMKIPSSPFKVLQYLKIKPVTSYSITAKDLGMSTECVKNAMVYLETHNVVIRMFKDSKPTEHWILDEGRWTV